MTKEYNCVISVIEHVNNVAVQGAPVVLNAIRVELLIKNNAFAILLHMMMV